MELRIASKSDGRVVILDARGDTLAVGHLVVEGRPPSPGQRWDLPVRFVGSQVGFLGRRGQGDTEVG